MSNIITYPDTISSALKQHIDDTEGYILNVLANQEKQCQYIVAMAQRSYDDMQKYPVLWGDTVLNNPTDDEFSFDLKLAYHSVLFFEKNFIHVQKEIAGQPFLLEAWQKWVLTSIFGWIRKNDKTRRYKRLDLIIPRKNGKTWFALGILNYYYLCHTFPNAEIYWSACNEEQARRPFRLLKREYEYLNKNDGVSLLEKFNVSLMAEHLVYNENGSEFKLNKGKAHDGSNPDAVGVDELHEHKNTQNFEAFSQGFGNSKEYLFITTTTAGRDISSLCYQHIQDGRKVALGLLENPIRFYIEYTLNPDDDWKDFDNWSKANPNLNVCKSSDELKIQYNEAMNLPHKRSEILTKQLNIWNNESYSWIELDKWLACGDDNLRLNDFMGQKVWLGVDLAEKIDLTVIALCFKQKEKYCLFVKCYLPRETVERPENAHYRAWEAQGYLNVIEGASVDQHILKNDIIEIMHDFDIQEIAYDPAKATYLMQDLEQFFSPEQLIEFKQSPAYFSEALDTFEAEYRNQRIVHNNDPVFTWCATNASLKETRSGQQAKLKFLVKKYNKDKIDALVASIMAFARCLANNQEPFDFDQIVFI